MYMICTGDTGDEWMSRLHINDYKTNNKRSQMFNVTMEMETVKITTT